MKKNLILFLLLSLALFIFTVGVGEAQSTDNQTVIVVQSIQDSGNGTLREALKNAKTGTTIRFSNEVFPKNTPLAIQVLSGLPPLKSGFITIDASDAGVILDGSLLSRNTGTNGLEISSDGNIIVGLQIINFPGGGISISNGARENRIGGPGQGEGNVIGGNWDGIGISGSGTANNLVIGNFIGTDASGTITNGNLVDGVWIGSGAGDNIIGGRFGTEGNLISGNSSSGIVLDTSSGNIVTGNIIGLAAQGEQPLGNSVGITIAGAHEGSARGNIIGGLEPGDRNLISGNSGPGIQLIDFDVNGNKVIGNDIGLCKDGKTSAGNKYVGVLITNSANQNEIGPENRIAFNGSDGIRVEGENTIGNIISRNSIFSNQGLAIGTYVGGNLEIDPPEINEVSSRIVRGHAGSDQLIEIFSDIDNESGYFEGETIANQTGAFYFLLPSSSFQNKYILVTARDQDGNTSQLSARMENSAYGVGKELPGIVAPAQVSTEPAVVSTNLALASVAVVFFGFTSTALNDILKNYTSEISAMLAKLIPANAKSFFSRSKKGIQPLEGFRWKFIWMWFVIVLVNAVIESFLDPSIPLLGSGRLSVILTLFAAGLAVSGMEWISDHYSHKLIVKAAVQRSEIQPAGLFLGIATVVFSRLMKFTPGYLYGIVGVVYLLPRITGKKQSGLRAFIVQATIFIGGLLLWGLSALLPEKLLWMEPFLLTVFLISLQGVLFELIPLEIFDGSDLWKWRKGVWLLFFAVVFFSFFHFMLNPSGSDLQALQQNSVKTLMIVMAIFGLITLGAWLTFSKPRREK